MKSNGQQKGDGHKTEAPDVSHIRNVEVTHERSDISVRGVMTFVVLLTIAAIVIHLGLWLLFDYFDAQAAKERPRGPMAFTEKKDRLPPAPLLQAAPGFAVTLENGHEEVLEKKPPQSEYRVLKQQWDETLNGQSKDQSGNPVGMPIEQAIKQIAPSLPSRVKTAPGKLEDYAIGAPSAWSSGRVSEKRLQ